MSGCLPVTRRADARLAGNLPQALLGYVLETRLAGPAAGITEVALTSPWDLWSVSFRTAIPAAGLGATGRLPGAPCAACAGDARQLSAADPPLHPGVAQVLKWRDGSHDDPARFKKRLRADLGGIDVLRNHLHMADNPGEALADIRHLAGPGNLAGLYERHAVTEQLTAWRSTGLHWESGQPVAIIRAPPGPGCHPAASSAGLAGNSTAGYKDTRGSRIRRASAPLLLPEVPPGSP